MNDSAAVIVMPDGRVAPVFGDERVIVIERGGRVVALVHA
jgi:hypothetical protein